MDSSRLPVVFDETGEAFESLAKENGRRTWSARRLMAALGYDNWSVFKKVVEKAMSSCARVGHSVLDHFFKGTFRMPDGRDVEDVMLSRFACGMTALNADSDNHNVAAMQAYFVSIAELFAEFSIQHAESMDRLAFREEISDREVTLSETAARAGVQSYSNFKVAGYIGMYEMDYQSIRRLRNVSDKPTRSILDFMGKDELAANLFRLTLTEGRIKKEGARGQIKLESVAREVGKRVRQTLHEETGLYPEDHKTAQNIREVKKGLRLGGKGMASALDNLDIERQHEQLYLQEGCPALQEDAVLGCSECASGSTVSHNGSAQCQSGSIASGGSLAHCRCEFCY